MSELIEVKTIAEVERIVNGSGLWDGTGPVEFSDDGETWSQAWTPTADDEHPQFARVEVYRKEVRIPTTVTIRWDEQYPAASDEWSAKWDRSPMRHFGRTVRMVGYRQTFRELLGNIVIEDEDHTDRPEAAPVGTESPAERDWGSEIAEAESLTLFGQIEKDARAARIFTPTPEGTALHIAFRARRRELTAALPDPWSPPAVPDARPAPQDHLPPANRAARRKARKKGGKR